MSATEQERKIFSAEFARLYQLANAAAARRYMRAHQVPHIAAGRDLFTRPSWLATWEASRVKNLTPTEYTTPRETMLATAAVLVGELVKSGKLNFSPVPVLAETQAGTPVEAQESRGQDQSRRDGVDSLGSQPSPVMGRTFAAGATLRRAA